jgi:hypothetical protein
MSYANRRAHRSTVPAPKRGHARGFDALMHSPQRRLILHREHAEFRLFPLRFSNVTRPWFASQIYRSAITLGGEFPFWRLR